MTYADQDKQDIAFITEELCKDFLPLWSCYPERTERYYFWKSLDEDVNKRSCRYLMQALWSSGVQYPRSPLIYNLGV